MESKGISQQLKFWAVLDFGYNDIALKSKRDTVLRSTKEGVRVGHYGPGT